jgi:hypothetical protein
MFPYCHPRLSRYTLVLPWLRVYNLLLTEDGRSDVHIFLKVRPLLWSTAQAYGDLLCSDYIVADAITMTKRQDSTLCQEDLIVLLRHVIYDFSPSPCL